METSSLRPENRTENFVQSGKMTGLRWRFHNRQIRNYHALRLPRHEFRVPYVVTLDRLMCLVVELHGATRAVKRHVLDGGDKSYCFRTLGGGDGLNDDVRRVIAIHRVYRWLGVVFCLELLLEQFICRNF